MFFEQDMLHALSQVEVENTSVKPEVDDVIEDIPGQPKDPAEEDFYGDEDLETFSNYMEVAMAGDLDPSGLMGETDLEKDFTTNPDEARTIAAKTKGKIARNKVAGNVEDVDGKKFLDVDGNVIVAYHEPGKNIINRKSAEEQRIESRMSKLSSLINRFKTEEEIQAEDMNPNVIIMDKESKPKRKLKRIEEVVSIQDDIELKVELVENTFKLLSKKIQEQAGLSNVNFNITNSDNLRALHNKEAIDEMDVTRIFILALFLEDPKSFPTDETFEQVQYRNSQAGAKSKTIEIKKLITYIASESEFNRTVDLVANIANREMNLSGLLKVFNIKCKEAFKTLIMKYLKNESVDPMAKVNVISIRQEVKLKYREYESTVNFIESLKNKLKLTPKKLKEQRKRAKEQLEESKLKINDLAKDVEKLEKEITIMLLLDRARKDEGLTKSFYQLLEKDEIKNNLKEYQIKIDSEHVDEILVKGIKEKNLEDIIKKN